MTSSHYHLIYYGSPSCMVYIYISYYYDNYTPRSGMGVRSNLFYTMFTLLVGSLLTFVLMDSLEYTYFTI